MTFILLLRAAGGMFHPNDVKHDAGSQSSFPRIDRVLVSAINSRVASQALVQREETMRPGRLLALSSRRSAGCEVLLNPVRPCSLFH